MRGLARRKETLEDELKNLSFRHETLKLNELKALFEMRQKLNMLTEKDRTSRSKLGNDIVRLESTSRKYLQELESYLDTIPVWSTKFSTGENPDQRNENIDSHYYITKSGISLRLKQANLQKQGLAGVIQPLMDKVMFESPDGVLSEQPQVGYATYEYLTPDFLMLQEQGQIENDFTSPLKVYIKDDKPYYIELPAGAPARYKHEGHYVNEILELKAKTNN